MNPVTEPGWLSGQTCLFLWASRLLFIRKSSTNRPITASHSRGTKLPCWRAKVALGQDKQRKLSSKITCVFCWSCPSATFVLEHRGFVPREWLAANSLSPRWLRLGIPGAASFVLRPGIILFLGVTHSALLEYHESTSPRPQ